MEQVVEEPFRNPCKICVHAQVERRMCRNYYPSLDGMLTCRLDKVKESRASGSHCSLRVATADECVRGYTYNPILAKV